ncbi:hypothetical protein ACLOJK_033683 [Asimina triloba]
MLINTVITRIANGMTFKITWESSMAPKDGKKLAITVQITTVPLSFVNWSSALGIGVLRSTGSFVAIARSVKEVALIEKSLQGNQSCRCRNPRRRSPAMAMEQTTEAAVILLAMPRDKKSIPKFKVSTNLWLLTSDAPISSKQKDRRGQAFAGSASVISNGDGFLPAQTGMEIEFFYKDGAGASQIMEQGLEWGRDQIVESRENREYYLLYKNAPIGEGGEASETVVVDVREEDRRRRGRRLAGGDRKGKIGMGRLEGEDRMGAGEEKTGPGSEEIGREQAGREQGRRRRAGQ